jgi:prepilin-type N-terminal cleavage/methylation domain-containing protein
MPTKKESGFTLIECLIAMVIMTFGLLAVIGLLAVGVRLQTTSRDMNAANSFARAKMEELESYQPTATQRLRGGSLTTNVTSYNDIPDARFVRRWLIETAPTDAGVPSNMQRISVVVSSNRSDVRVPVLQVSVLVPAS